jgi:hypothetical protein
MTGIRPTNLISLLSVFIRLISRLYPWIITLCIYNLRGLVKTFLWLQFLFIKGQITAKNFLISPHLLKTF